MNRALQVEYQILKLCKRYTHAQPYGTARPDLGKFITKTIPGPGNADTEVVDALKRLHQDGRLELTKYNHVHQRMLSYADYGGDAFFYGEGGDGSDLSINWTHQTQPYYENLKFMAKADEPKPPIGFSGKET